MYGQAYMLQVTYLRPAIQLNQQSRRKRMIRLKIIQMEHRRIRLRIPKQTITKKRKAEAILEMDIP